MTIISELVHPKKKTNHFIVWLPPAVRNRHVAKLAINISFLVIKIKQGILQHNIPQKYYSTTKFCTKKDTITNKCKCIYYISLMTVLSCQSILISSGHVLKLNFIHFCREHFDWPFTKNSWYFDTPQTLTFFTNMVQLYGCYSKEYLECTSCFHSLLEKNFYL